MNDREEDLFDVKRRKVQKSKVKVNFTEVQYIKVKSSRVNLSEGL